MSEYKTMKEIGAEIDLSSHQVGRRLKELGLRTPDGKPSDAAFAQRLVEQRFAEDGQNYCWSWEESRILALLGGPSVKLEPRSAESPTTNDRAATRT